MADILNKFQTNQETKVIDASKKVRIGIIGCGGIARAHMREYLKMPDVEIVAVADLVVERCTTYLNEAAPSLDHSKIHIYKSHKELIDNEKLDAVSVCTYNTTHAECAIYALEHGVNVLLEKPLAVTLEEGVAIAKAAKKSGKILSIGFQPRFHPNMQMVKSVVQSGALGKIYYIQTGGGRRRGIPINRSNSFIQAKTAGIGAMGDIGCYSLDMVLNSIGYPKPLTVTGYTSDFFGKDPEYFKGAKLSPENAELFSVEDFAAGFIRLEGGIMLDFRISWAMHLDSPGDTIIMGTKGSLRIPATECWNGDIGGDLTLYQTVAGELVETVFKKHAPAAEGCFYYKVRSFLDAVKENGKAPVCVDQILINQAIIDGIIESNKLGHEVEISIPEI